jgi:hypothetical protein
MVEIVKVNAVRQKDINMPYSTSRVYMYPVFNLAVIIHIQIASTAGQRTIGRGAAKTSYWVHNGTQSLWGGS